MPHFRFPRLFFKKKVSVRLTFFFRFFEFCFCMHKKQIRLTHVTGSIDACKLKKKKKVVSQGKKIYTYIYIYLERKRKGEGETFYR